jgi:formate-dependent phosphoribosylglycinamide formyltransferase (GAR transformylase)
MPRNVVFVAPFPTETTMRFVRAVANLDDVRLLGVCHASPKGKGARAFDDVVRVSDALSGKDMIDAIDLLQRRHGKIDRIVGILEMIMVQLAQARTHFGIKGTRPEVAELFRDKSLMKAKLTEAGLPVAKNRLIRSVSDAESFANDVGFPLVLKPPAGMGAKATYRIDSHDALRGALGGMGVSAGNPVLAEEFLKGREFSFETITLGGKPRTYSISHYLPTCLEVLENDWMQWVCLLPREIEGPEYDGARKLGIGCIEALGLDDGATHMEWFQRTDGSMAIGEIAQRPPGANITPMIGHVHGIDPHRAWARAVVDGELDAPWERKAAAASVFLRGMGRGRVSNVTGLHECHEAVGKWIVEADIPTVGAPKKDGYEGDGYIVVRHPSTDAVKDMVQTILATVKVHYSG